MKLAIERDELLRGLGRVQAIVERRGTMPILANVLIERARTDSRSQRRISRSRSWPITQRR